ncbi:TrkA family potassium uptake protein [Thiospirochaeta perfilievii]|uniref:TrkA family potassium uptake protein n=1 Tax=Thiospirochaeta perfilievii TaxID=252967 RepID=A0A5C1QDZ9_9SPIO|nr:TrkA family potassium uptake protein [Thiospirochaeta perfilievii]QEN05300.1 TrkA family potassium uptake protein [Thiospirochaeta perfilievii]
MVKTFAVIGLGLFGRKVCEVLIEKGGEVIAIDNSPDQVNKVKDFVTQAILLDTTDDETIDDAPLDHVDAAIVAIGDNIEASILTTTLLKQIGVPYVIARAVNKTHYRVLKKLGADEVINIEEDEGRSVALNLINPSVLKKVILSKNVILSEINLPKNFIDLKVGDLDLKDKFSIRIMAIRRVLTKLDSDGNSIREELFLYIEDVDKFLDGDILLVSGATTDIEKFSSSIEV